MVGRREVGKTCKFLSTGIKALKMPSAMQPALWLAEGGLRQHRMHYVLLKLSLFWGPKTREAEFPWNMTLSPAGNCASHTICMRVGFN